MKQETVEANCMTNLGEEDFISLSPELIQKYMQLFKYPCIFI